MINTLTVPSITLLLWLVVSYLLSRGLRRNDVADPMWGLGFVALAWASIQSFFELDFRGRILLLLISFWGLRLSTYLWMRLLRKPEDHRYQNMRKSWGNQEALRAFFIVFLFQAFLLSIIAAPFVLTLIASHKAYQPLQLGGWDFLGFSLALLGLFFEIVADGEMNHFKTRAQKNQVLETGLWSLSRHPNYFGEILFWWGAFFLCLQGPLSWWAVVSPLLITFLLLKVSGVPMLEQLMKEKGKSYLDYRQKTRAILPFGSAEVWTFLGIGGAMLILDIGWLGFLMKDFYVAQAKALIRVDLQGGYDPLLWAVAGVYLCIPLGIQIFAVLPSQKTGEVIFRGGLFGFISYGIYDFTNLSLLKDWPLEMAMVDLGWGAFLCACSAYVGHRIKMAQLASIAE